MLPSGPQLSYLLIKGEGTAVGGMAGPGASGEGSASWEHGWVGSREPAMLVGIHVCLAGGHVWICVYLAGGVAGGPEKARLVLSEKHIRACTMRGD